MADGRQRQARLPLLGAALSYLVRNGELTVTDARGGRSVFGDPEAEPHLTVRLHARLLPIRLALDPVLATGEAYMDGSLTIEHGSVRDFLLMVSENLDRLQASTIQNLLIRLNHLRAWLQPSNDYRRSRKNVEHHYDLPPAFYDLFLDDDHIYSCAYFRNGTETLEQAQAAKLHHIMAKLLLTPDCRVLDIGSGWGALATTIAEQAGASVTGLTLSGEQLSAARERALERGVSDRATFELSDYRDARGSFDRIVSIGMLEHVGKRNLDGYFSKLAALLADDGVALVHSIGSTIPPDAGGLEDRWIGRYIFPGGYIPSLSEVIAAAERADLWVIDVEILRLHYAQTLRCWWDRFQAARDRAKAMMGERFCRMWEFYLASAEAGFRNRPLMVFQLQLARNRHAVPLTRDYITDTERHIERSQYRRQRLPSVAHIEGSAEIG